MADENQEATEQSAPTNETVAPEQTQEQTATETTDEGHQQAKTAGEVQEDGDKGDKPVKRLDGPLQQRIDQLTKARREAERKAAALEIELEQIRKGSQKPEGNGPENPEQPKNLDELIERQVEQRLQQRTYQQRVNDWGKAGSDEFRDFNERCNLLADLGAGDRPDFMQIVTDPTTIPNGHRVVAALADDPNEAARILALPTHTMSAELARFAEKLNAKPKGNALSRAPAPIKPINGTAKPSEEPTSDDAEEEWFRKRAVQRAQRKTARSL